MSAPDSTFAWLSGVMLPTGGLVAVFDLEGVFDESGTHEGSPVVCMAGYIMEFTQARELEKEWNAVLNWDQLPHPLPYFHMSDCAPDPGNGVFANLTKSQRKQIVSRLIAIIKRRTIQGVAITVNVAEFEELLSGDPFHPDPYVLVGHAALQAVSRYVRANIEDVGRVAYFFEHGHKSAVHANALMNMFLKQPQFEDEYRYEAHGFLKKLGNPTVQAADLLAWQWLKDRKNLAEGRPRRKDLESLLIHPHTTSHIDRDTLSKLASLREPAIQAISELMGQRK